MPLVVSKLIRPLPLILAGVVVLCLAGGGWLLVQLWHQRPGEVKPPQLDPAQKYQAVPAPDVQFTDVTRSAGIRFIHFNGASGQKLLPETMGSGVAFLDYDSDGKQDLLFVNSSAWPGATAEPRPTLALYHNDGGKFTDVTAAMGLNVTLYGLGVTVGDYNNDGWPDVFITAVGGNRLFRNEAGKRFVDVTEEAGLAGPGLPKLSGQAFMDHAASIPFPSSATFLDYDGDGWLDLFVCNYVTWSPAMDRAIDASLEGVGRAYVPPKAFEGTQCALYRNVAGKRFEDVSAKAGVQVFDREGVGKVARVRSVGKSLGVIVCDPDEDGWPDVIVANDTVRNFFFHNRPGPDGTRRFEEKGETVNVAYADGKARGGMGIDWGEFRPGCCAAVITNFANEPDTFFCLNNPRSLLFADEALSVGLVGPSRVPLKFGCSFFDYDLDGRLDLLTCNGHLEPEIAKVQRSQKYKQSAQLFWNSGRRAGCFVPVSPEQAGSDLFTPLVGRGSAFADIDDDGDLDVVLTNNNGSPLLLRNDNNLGHHWVRLVLTGDGKRSNASSIGAQVTVEAGGLVQKRQVTAGRGYLSQCELPLTFGLGKCDKIDRVEIRWPGKNAGAKVLTNLAVNQVHRIVQE